MNTIKEKAGSIHTQKLTLSTLYDTYEINEPVIAELIACPAFQRLKKINQYGVAYYITKQEFSRYDHSIGVFVLLHQYQVSLEEQIAGLLHDVSHTIFSHVGDFIFNHQSKTDSYQDNIHEWYLQQTEIPEIVEKYGIPFKNILHKNEMFTALEQELPNVCADRLEYNLYGGFIANLLTKEDIASILEHVHFINNQWYFTSVSKARQFAQISINLNLYHYGSIWNHIISIWAAHALKRALKIKLISNHDIHFSTDDIVWNILNETQDLIIQELLFKIIHYKQFYSVSTEDHYDIHLKPKFRGLNPWVQIGNKCERLTECDESFKQQFEHVKKKIDEGWYVTFTA